MGGSSSDRLLYQLGHEDHADVNAAKNILAAGHAVLVCGEELRPTPSKAVKAVSMNQEPSLNQRVA
ncbi:MAG: hypothetical protein B7Y25_08495 [Alphaproteobacteria bacterium 16-39-46]|nr:MAG: hypothetical protein B7Y25_08495 [Alphaproteobacteria bacterium 16-39-46]OZA43136.1 MAG: hypothetical protein B7X84_04115 [Alphaproteobacteria bacterium 17-39-52]